MCLQSELTSPARVTSAQLTSAPVYLVAPVPTVQITRHDLAASEIPSHGEGLQQTFCYQLCDARLAILEETSRLCARHCTLSKGTRPNGFGYCAI